MHSLGQRCLSFSRAETVAQLKVTESRASSVGDRQWLYQTSMEFRFYVTCEDPSCPPSSCSVSRFSFGLPSSSVAQAVARTNAYYGSQTPGATQVLFVNGEQPSEPALWVASGPLESALLIPGASHCMDMAPETPLDSPSLWLGHHVRGQWLQAWLRLALRSLARVGG
uniref:Serine protease 16 n=1 Tax=Suricata suricatta TaxID=37032 RepID=A0A673UBQ6_SURSU